jgi:ATP-dependent DNA helicase RecG
MPRMLDQAMAWARRTFDTYIVNEPDGSVRDRYAYPLAAFRELIANAIIHCDLNSWSAGLAIEALASGIPIVTEAIAEAGLPPACYTDSGIRFTVVIHRHAPQPATMSSLERLVFTALERAPRTVAQLEEETGIPAYTLRRALRSLREQGLAEQLGGRGRPTTYRQSPGRN